MEIRKRRIKNIRRVAVRKEATEKGTPIIQSTPVQPATAATEITPDSGLAPRDEFQASSQDKPKLTDRFRSLIGSMFDE